MSAHRGIAQGATRQECTHEVVRDSILHIVEKHLTPEFLAACRFPSNVADFDRRLSEVCQKIVQFGFKS